MRGANPSDNDAFAAGVRWKSEKRETESHLLARTNPVSMSIGLPFYYLLRSFPVTVYEVCPLKQARKAPSRNDECHNSQP